MNNSYLSRGRDQRTSSDADQAEAAAFRSLSAVVDQGLYDERVSSSMDDFDPLSHEDNERWHQEDIKNDSASGAVLEELERRAKMMGDSYPFSLEGSALRYTGTGGGLYEFLLAVSVAPNITSGNFVRLPRIFERMSCRIVAYAFGPAANFAHVGSPRDKESGLNFKDAMHLLSERTGEWKWGPEEKLNPARAKDEGVDFVVWPKDWDGRRLAQLFVLGQCACGNDWDTKYNDLSLNKLRKWFKPMTIVDPVRVFTTPFQIVDMKLEEASRDAGYVYDRARLVMIDDHQKEIDLYPEHTADLDDLVNLVLKS